jgi:hypothetical protein
VRLWSLDPKYLDAKGLVALWREALLAKKVIEGDTKGYKNHPQLQRFKESGDSLANIKSYLYGVYLEAESRGYHFLSEKIGSLKVSKKKIKVNSDQVNYEFFHLLNKLKTRDNQRYLDLKKVKKPKVHFLFKVITGKVEKWEKIK